MLNSNLYLIRFYTYNIIFLSLFSLFTYNNSIWKVKLEKILQTIAENPRFQLLPTIAKDINIDDDMQNFRIHGDFMKPYQTPMSYHFFPSLT